MANRVFLNMGVKTGPGGDAFEDVVDISRYIPDDHRYLVLFLSSGIGRAAKLLTEAVSKDDRGLVLAACDELILTHRYFEDVHKAYAYINRSLAQSICRDKKIKDKKGMFSRLSLTENETDAELDCWLPEGHGKGTVYGLVDAHEALRLMTAIVFDDSGGLSVYPQQVRNGLFGLACAGPGLVPEIKMAPAKNVLPVPRSMAALRAAMDFDEDFHDTLCAAVRELACSGSDVPEKLKAILDRVTDPDDTESSTIYETPYLEDILSLEVSLMAMNGTRLKKCMECGRYFPITTNNDRFCNIPDADGSSCLIRNMREEFKKEVSSIRSRAYKTHYARVIAGKETRESLDEWRKKARELQEGVFSGNLTLEQYKERIMG